MKINNINNAGPKRLIRQGSEQKRQNINNTVLNSNINNNKVNSTPAFKGPIDGFCLGLAELIENGGLVISFTLQDMLGTNLPRPIMGLTRNSKENKGQVNKSFAAKELVREMLTGPSMFAIPAGILYAGQKIFGKNVKVPMQFIQDFGSIHAKTPVNEAGKAITTNEFYSNTFAEMIKNAKGETEVGEATKTTAKKWADSLSEALSKATNKEGKKALKGKINELSDEFTAIAKGAAINPKYADFTTVTLDKASGSFKDATEFMTFYADSAIKKAKSHIEENGKDAAVNFIKKMTDANTLKRLGTNIAMFAGVISFLTIIPKIYNKAEGEGNSGLTGLMKEETLNSTTPEKTANKNTQQPTFKGDVNNAQQPSFKGNFVADAAKTLTSGKLGSKLANTEFKGFNLSLPLLLGVMGLGVLAPRVKQAKDKYDMEEILRRDLVTCAVMAFGEKVLCKLLSKVNEAKSGFILTNKAANFDKLPTHKKAWDYIRPQQGIGILSSDKIIAKYSNVDQYKDGIVGFAQSISDEGGNLAKMFSLDGKSAEAKTAKELIEKMLGNGKKIANVDNNSIIEALKNAKGSAEEAQLVKMFARGAETEKGYDWANILKTGLKKVDIIKENPWVKRAKTLNARFTAFSVLILVPVFLGFMLPAINERATKKRIREEQAAAEAQKAKAMTNINHPTANKIFDDIKPQSK